MSDRPDNFFHPQQLAVAFMQCAARALREQQIDPQEHAWLEAMVSTATAHGSARIDLLGVDDGSDPPALTGTLMFSDPGTPSWRVFLQSPIYGLEAFDNRVAAEETLRQRITQHETTLEASLVQGEVFTAQMNGYLSQRARRLERMAEALARLPALDEIGNNMTTADSATDYQRALHQFWKTATSGSKHLHQLASKTFAEGFYQDLAEARLTIGQTPNLQLDPEWHPLRAPAMRCEKILVRLGNEWVELAGAFTFGLETENERMLFWPYTGLLPMASHGAINTYLDGLAAPQNLPLNRVEQWHVATPRAYKTQPITQSVFVDRIDSIVTLQELNLAHILSTASDEVPAAQVAVNAALDVRALIDRRLQALDPTLRWTQYVNLAGRHPPATNPVFKPLLQSIERLAWLGGERDALYQVMPGVRTVAQRLLKPALAVFAGNLEPDTLLRRATASSQQGSAVQGPAAQDTSLVDLLFQRVSGFSSVPISARDGFCRQDLQSLPFVPPAAIEQILSLAQPAFTHQFAAQLEASRSLSLCLDKRWLQVPALLRTNLEDGLRLEMALHDYFVTLPPALLHRLKQVLDTPLASQRQALGQQQTRVFGLQLDSAQPNVPGIRLKLALLIDQPGSIDQALLFWSPVEGLKAYADLEQLSTTLLRNMTSGPRRDDWLDLMPAVQAAFWKPQQQKSVHWFSGISTWAIEGDPLDEVQATLQQEQNDNATTALQLSISAQYRPGIFEPFIDAVYRHDALADYFETQSLRFADLHTREVLPDWLNLAAPADLAAFSMLLRRAQETLRRDNSYLFGIPTIADFTRKQLYTRLAQDFAAQPIDPDEVIITLKSFTAAPVPTGQIPSAISAATLVAEYSLTQAATDHFSKNPDAVMFIRKADGTALPTGLTPVYLRAVISELDLGGKYLVLLSKAFSPENPQLSLRQERFSAMACTTLMLSTLQHVLEDDWSRKALAYVNAVLEMPDGLARQPVDGQAILFSRLQLRAAEDMAPDPITNVYVIYPATEDQGPVIVFTAFTNENNLRLYPDRAALLTALHTDPVLQSQLFARLLPDARRTYDNGGWLEPHIPWSTEASFDIAPRTPGPVRLHLEPLTGNALAVMFQDTIEHVKVIATTQSITSAQAQWQRFTDLMTLGAEQASAFLPGRLAVLVGLWQSKSWIGAATDAARKSQWGKALSEFAAALASLGSTLAVEEPEMPASSPTSYPVPTSLSTAQRLRSFEVRNVSLVNLLKDLALPIYREGQMAYAAVQGRVYRIIEQDGAWHIFTGASHPGPKIRLDAERHWVLDQPDGLRGGGIGSSRIDTVGSDLRDIDVWLEERFTVKATGMAQIRTADRVQARQIQAAHALALRYLRTCLINLDADKRAGFIPHTSDVILQAVFGFPATPATLTQRLRNMVSDIYVDLLSPGLSPKSSTRFISGAHKQSDSTADAFVFRNDPSRRVFLAESFFSYRPVIYPVPEAQISGFDARTHFQAAVLIHELSHINNRTSDIAYLESGAPFADLISSTHTQIQAQLLDTQNRSLSLHTPREQLFKMSRNGALEDLGDKDQYAYSAVLKLTKTRTLEEARDVFYNDPIKRCNVILANADTIALLVTKLGRVPFHAVPV